MGNSLEEAIEISLKTWYPENHPLRLNPHHPLGKLLGEWGELLDDYMKSLYKPGYEFEPEDELGDIWYYLRILAYQNGHELRELDFNVLTTTDIAISQLMIDVATALIEGHIINIKLDIIYTVFIGIAQRYNLTLDQLTASNWEKLKPGSERGDQWRKAKTKYG